MSIKSVTSIKHITPKKPANWGLTSDAKMFYLQQGSKTIYCTFRSPLSFVPTFRSTDSPWQPWIGRMEASRSSNRRNQ